MIYREYRVRYGKTGEEFVKPFTVEQYPYVIQLRGVPEPEALEIINNWNRQNRESGFTYWLE